MAPMSMMKVLHGESLHQQQRPVSPRAADAEICTGHLRKALQAEKSANNEIKRVCSSLPNDDSAHQTCEAIISTEDLLAIVQQVEQSRRVRANADVLQQGQEIVQNPQEFVTKDDWTDANGLWFTDLLPSNPSEMANHRKRTPPPSEQPRPKKVVKKLLSDPNLKFLEYCSEEIQTLTKDVERKSEVLDKAKTLVRKYKKELRGCRNPAAEQCIRKPLADAKKIRDDAEIQLREAEDKLDTAEKEEDRKWRGDDDNDMLKMWD
ncbi:MAG: hypothetical protein Q9183_002744 [Haloplaca sp. 2 TL-2023]